MGKYYSRRNRTWKMVRGYSTEDACNESILTAHGTIRLVLERKDFYSRYSGFSSMTRWCGGKL